MSNVPVWSGCIHETAFPKVRLMLSFSMPTNIRSKLAYAMQSCSLACQLWSILDTYLVPFCVGICSICLPLIVNDTIWFLLVYTLHVRAEQCFCGVCYVCSVCNPTKGESQKVHPGRLKLADFAMHNWECEENRLKQVATSWLVNSICLSLDAKAFLEKAELHLFWLTSLNKIYCNAGLKPLRHPWIKETKLPVSAYRLADCKQKSGCSLREWQIAADLMFMTLER